MIATNAMSMAAIPAANFNPSIAPLAAASTIVELSGNTGDVSDDFFSESDDGMTILESINPAGADIKLAVSKEAAETPI